MKEKQDYLIQKLVRLGLRAQEAEIYLFVLKHQSVKVIEVSKQLKIMVPGVHRALGVLKTKGLIQSNGKRPIKLRAIDPSIALSQLIEQSRQESLTVKQEIEAGIKSSKLSEEELRVEFLENKEEAFDHSIAIINNLKQELLILSIGETIPSELFVAITRAVQRGVIVKMLAEKYDDANKEMLKNWQKNGWQVRYLAKPKVDFSLVLYDTKISQIQIRKEDEIDSRVGMIIYNPAYAKAQKHFFEELWRKGKEI